MKIGLNQMNIGNFFVSGVEHHQDPAQVLLECVAFSPWLVVEPARQTTPMQQSPLITSILMQTPAPTPSVKLTQMCAELKLSITPWSLPLQEYLRVFCKGVLLVCTVLGLVSETSHLIGRHSAVQLKPPS